MRAALARRRRHVRAIVAIVACVVAVAVPACTPGRTPEPERGSDRAAVGGALPTREEFVDRGLELTADTRADLRAALGAPDRVFEEVIPNRHVPGVRDTIFTLHYPQLVARVHHPGGGGDLMSMVEVSSNSHLRFPILGLSVQEIDAAFGRPDEASDSSLTYYCTTCIAGHDPVEIVFEDGEARRVRFNYYVD